MFETEMAARLKRIFDFDKVSYDRPGESREQEGLFIDVEKADVRIRDGRQIVRAEGVIRVFVNKDKMSYGYLAKSIAEADLEDTRGFFFGPEENSGNFRNIAERKFDFTFLFDSQYDPAIGTITSIETSYTES